MMKTSESLTLDEEKTYLEATGVIDNEELCDMSSIQDSDAVKVGGIKPSCFVKSCKTDGKIPIKDKCVFCKPGQGIFENSDTVIYNEDSGECKTATCKACYSLQDGTCTEDPPTDCVVTNWGPWRGCDASSDKLTRSRTIISEPLCGGTPCPTETDLVEELPCTYERVDQAQPYGLLYKTTADGDEPCEVVCDEDDECVAFTRNNDSGVCNYYKQDGIYKNENGIWLPTNFDMDTFFKTDDNKNRVFDISKLDEKETVFEFGANISRVINNDVNARMCITNYLESQECTKSSIGDLTFVSKNDTCKAAVNKMFDAIQDWNNQTTMKVPALNGDMVDPYPGSIDDGVRYAANVIPELRSNIPGCDIITERPGACYFTEKTPGTSCKDDKYYNLVLKYIDPDTPRDMFNSSLIAFRNLPEAGCCE